MFFFDREIMIYVNHFAQHSWTFDKTMTFIAYNNLIKSSIIVAIFWWAWFKNKDRNSHDREYIITTLCSSIFAIFLARGLALTLPLRLRPIHEASLHFLLPYGEEVTALDGWSAFPSDHAVLFFTLATGLCFVSRWAGIFALAYTIFIICFPRIYLGLHYPTDAVGGAVLGVAISMAANICLARNKYVKLIEGWSYSRPEFFYPLFFLLTYQIADMFDNSRALAGALLKLKIVVGC
ncbi:MAG: phosphatase PAP2 family protein [Victivallaceae bacterium]|jgi:undecaprenyl-diphosphatase